MYIHVHTLISIKSNHWDGAHKSIYYLYFHIKSLHTFVCLYIHTAHDGLSNLNSTIHMYNVIILKDLSTTVMCQLFIYSKLTKHFT